MALTIVYFKIWTNKTVRMVKRTTALFPHYILGKIMDNELV